MNDDAAVAEEGADAGLCRGVEFEVAGLESRGRRDIAVFSREVADLARLRLRRVTCWAFTAFVWVEMAESGGAAARGLDGVDVDVVDWYGG